LSMTEYEREHDDCPMYFDDGEDPYRNAVDQVTVLRARSSSHDVMKTRHLTFSIFFIYFLSILFA